MFRDRTPSEANRAAPGSDRGVRPSILLLVAVVVALLALVLGARRREEAGPTLEPPF